MRFRIGPMKITAHSLRAFFAIAAATVSAIFVISSLKANPAHEHANSAHAYQTPAVDSAQQLAVLSPVQQMFDGMSKRDAAAIKKPVLAGGVMVLMRDGKPTRMTFEEFADREVNRELRKSKSEFTIRSSGSTTTSLWCGLPLNFWSMARWTTAELTCSTSFVSTVSGSLPVLQTQAAKIAVPQVDLTALHGSFSLADDHRVMVVESFCDGQGETLTSRARVWRITPVKNSDESLRNSPCNPFQISIQSETFLAFVRINKCG